MDVTFEGGVRGDWRLYPDGCDLRGWGKGEIGGFTQMDVTLGGGVKGRLEALPRWM